MAQNFEIIINLDAPVTMADGSKKQWTIDDAIAICEAHPCEWICAPHVPDEMSNFNHWHVGIHTSSNNEYATIAKWFGLPVNAVQKIKKQFKSTYALYLVHYNQGNKTPVDPSLVRSNFDIDYDKLKKNVEGAKRLDTILDGIDNGTIKPYNITQYVTINEFTKWKRQIDNAFEFRTQKLKGVDRKMDCVFINGDSGTGKTTYAKKICHDRGLTTYISSGSNDVLDDYKGEDAIILDDLRPSSLRLSDLLKMLDNNTASSVASRYRNKVLECKLIVITSTLDIETFFGSVFENENETKIQLMRRCGIYITMTTECIIYRTYDPVERGYKLLTTMDNIILKERHIEQMTEEQRLNTAISILGATSDMVNYMKQGLEKRKQIRIEGFEKMDDEQIQF